MVLRQSLTVLASACLVALVVPGCSSGPASSNATEVEEAPKPGSLAYDKGVWHDLLDNHQSIRREVTLLEDGVKATTESDDPKVAALIQDHAKAMQSRLKRKSGVRMWDPVFVDLFKNGHRVKLEIEQTEKGVRIAESSDDPETVKLLHSHAMGVSEFVHEGFEAATRATKRID